MLNNDSIEVGAIARVLPEYAETEYERYGNVFEIVGHFVTIILNDGRKFSHHESHIDILAEYDDLEDLMDDLHDEGILEYADPSDDLPGNYGYFD